MDPAGRWRVDENGGAHVARRRRCGMVLRDRRKAAPATSRRSCGPTR